MIVFYGLGWLAGRDIFGIGGKGACPKNPYVGIWSGVLFDRESFLVMLFARIPITSYHVFLLKYCSCLLVYDQITSPPLYFSFAVAPFENASEIAFLKVDD